MTDSEIYARQGMGKSIGLGKSPALLMVDFVNGFADPRHFGGPDIVEAINATVPLLAYARNAGWPVCHTRIVYADDGSNLGAFATKAAGLASLTEQAGLSQIVDELEPVSGEHVIRKQQASAFFNTDLAAWLVWRQIDTVLVTGCTTSGCVRATVVDACSCNFRTIVVEDCVADRAKAPHDANMFDMQQKYADVMHSSALMAHFQA